MPLKANIQGMVHHYPDSFKIGREQVRQFARAIKADDPATFDEDAAAALGHDNAVASLTFPSILALLVQQDFFRKVDVGMTTMQIVQVDQKFVFHRPLVVGDTLRASLEIQSVVERFGADIVVTRSVCVNADGEIVLEAFTTLMGHDGDNSISVKWDPETGQVVRSAVGD
ncbi:MULTISPECIES: (3R)-hydroxyacyl-ACP dehydratase subunit HadC [unclassified Mycobacterium]|uniref:(3R)-hydroxyacyl-ACP dehydratase subunit HadC n=1 Tax=unclassified Mycobacterium TaxID=2642494 RepID=UPI0029C6F6F7|nr:MULTISPECIES: (3R)-hydroxyacyl-ACP dehydratase subunit HadC [unclassified Mycobacterium]